MTVPKLTPQRPSTSAQPRCVRRAMREMGTLPWFLLFIFVFCLMSCRDLFFSTALGGMMENAITGDAVLLRNYLYLLAIAAFISVPLQYAVAYLDGRFSIFGTRNLFLRIFPALGRIPESFYEKGKTAAMQSRMTADVEKVQTFFHSELSSIVWTCAYAIVPLFYLLYLNPALALVSYAVLPLVYWVLNKALEPLSRLTSNLSAAQAESLSAAQETIEQAELVKSYGLEEEMLQRYQQAQEKAFMLFRKRKVREALANGINRTLYLLPMLMMVLLGVWMLQRGWLTITEMMIFIQLGDSGQWLISDLSTMVLQVRTANGHLTRLYEAADAPRERQGGEEPLPEQEPVIRLRDVRFAYEGREEVLKGLNLSIFSGESVAVVGRSGSGKSTLFKLLEGFYTPEKGAVEVFGQDTSVVNLSSARQRMALVPQDPYLFAGTLRDNLTLGREGLDDARLLEAMRLAGFKDLTSIWPEGLDARVEQSGNNLSGGQKQRLAIARALLRDAQVLLFDEVTSALDYESEREVVRAVQSLQHQHTLLIISHRLSIAQGADRIVVMDEGRIVQEGTHQQLLAQEGLYRELWRIESEGGKQHA